MIILIAVFAYIFFLRPLVSQNFLSQGIIYVCISIIIIGLFFVMMLYEMLDLTRKIVISDTTIMINKPFKVIEINWQDILEFKKQEKGFAENAGWKYLLKYHNGRGEKQVELADNNIENLHELITLIFENAKKSKFIQIKNDTFLPFFKNYVISEWEKD